MLFRSAKTDERIARKEIALFVAKRLSPLDDVLSTATHFVLRTYKKEGRLYQDEEIDERECTVL